MCRFVGTIALYRKIGDRFLGFADGGLGYLETSNPDLAVGDGEAHDVVDEGFGFSGAFGDAEDVGEDFFDEEEVWGGGESGVEGKDRAGAFQAIAREVEFGHCMYYERGISVPL